MVFHFHLHNIIARGILCLDQIINFRVLSAWSLKVELNATEQTIVQLELQIEGLAAKPARKQQLNAVLAATVTKLHDKLELVRANADSYDGIVAIFREEAGAYQIQLSEVHNETQLYRWKKIDLN